jgi:EAL domain-containing protein (putative c-di-GMP-specific phosphodiesterase class I)
LRESDIALYRAKGAGKARAILFDPAMHARAMQRLELETDLRRAVELNEFVVYYQPEVDLLDGRLYGVEALVRWQHPTRGLLNPDEFIEVAEETGLILDIGPRVLEQACRDLRRWGDQVPDRRPLALSVNLSPREFQCPGLLAAISGIIEASGVAPEQIRIEITESVMVQDTAAALATMHALKALGLQLAIDDFGTGYSSLSYLRQFPVDTLKVDRSFLTELATDAGTVAIVRAVTTLAHELKIAVTAEGIETIEQVASAVALHCDRGQGYYFSPPMPFERMTAHLMRGE